jgi:hypothetical protein
MPLSLARCGTAGGDVEMIPTLKLLAERHPDVDFILVGRNTGELPAAVGLPTNVSNPWVTWQPLIRAELNAAGLNHGNLTIDEHVRVREILEAHTRATFESLDGLVSWLGQHGTTNTPLPSIQERSRLTKPYDWSSLYCSYLLWGVNAWRDADPLRREEVLLNADPRNYPKYRDTKWPLRHPVLAQYDVVNTIKHERYGDATGFEWWHLVLGDDVDVEPGRDENELWRSKVRSVYSRLEISALVPGTPFGDTVKFDDDFERPHDLGLVINETRREGALGKTRRQILRDWVLPLEPAFIRGKWSDQSQRELGVEITPVPVVNYLSLLQTARCTLTTPSSGSGWATAKPWEAFAAGVVCFFHNAYDDQDHILGDAPPELRAFLRVGSAAELAERVRTVSRDRETWRWAVKLQREHFERAVAELRWLRLIEERLEL